MMKLRYNHIALKAALVEARDDLDGWMNKRLPSGKPVCETVREAYRFQVLFDEFLVKETEEEYCAREHGPASYQTIYDSLMSAASSAQFLGATEAQVKLIATLASQAGDSLRSLNGGSGILLKRDASLIIETYKNRRG